MAVLVIAEHDNVRLRATTLPVITAATELSEQVTVLVAGSQANSVADELTQIWGVSKVLYADAAQLATGLAEHMTAQVLSVAAQFSHILFPATAFGKNIAPRVAAKLDVAQITDVIRIHSVDTFERPIYAGNIITKVQSLDSCKILTVRTTAFAAAEYNGIAASDCKVDIVAIEAVLGQEPIQFVERTLSKNDRPELASAQVIVSGGRGLGSGEQFLKVLTPLADKLEAALGASRAAVDAGYASNDLQVGQTGKIVAPALYIAVGISGAIQHLAGMKDSKVIVAINKDPDAPIFSVADYGLVADLFEVIPELVATLP